LPRLAKRLSSRRNSPNDLANALEDQGQLDAALAEYRQAASLNPGFVEAHTNCANVLRKLGRSEEAAAVCEHIIKHLAGFGRILGNILKELSQPDEAVRAYRRALALRPDFAEVYTNLGNVLQGEEAFEEAVEVYRQAISLRPDLAEAHANMGATLEGLGRLDEAIDSYNTAVKLNPKLLAIRVWLHHKRRFVCNWEGIETDERELRALMASAREPVHPFQHGAKRGRGIGRRTRLRGKFRGGADGAQAGNLCGRPEVQNRIFVG
jgi:protein O-GlcNAc transferase